MKTLFALLLVATLGLLLFAPGSHAFVVTRRLGRTVLAAPLGMGLDHEKPSKEAKKKNNSFKNPFADWGEMFANWDNVMDDFLNKRMGNGEVFYGKRKYKPSGRVHGSYNGMGLTDKLRIEMTRQYKEELSEMRLRHLQEEEDAKKRWKP